MPVRRLLPLPNLEEDEEDEDEFWGGPVANGGLEERRRPPLDFDPVDDLGAAQLTQLQEEMRRGRLRSCRFWRPWSERHEGGREENRIRLRYLPPLCQRGLLRAIQLLIYYGRMPPGLAGAQFYPIVFGEELAQVWLDARRNRDELVQALLTEAIEGVTMAVDFLLERPRAPHRSGRGEQRRGRV